MTQLITEIIDRMCCQWDDLVPEGPLRVQGHAQYTRCRHCKQLFEFVSYTDAAGDTDWTYRKVKMFDA